jgi:acetylornithine deacetylase
MDSVTLLEFARELIDIESTTGREHAAGEWLVDRLGSLGYRVTRQAVDADRFNVLAIIDSPAVVLSTHYDCVPPYFASRLEDGKLFGRGACDAKGILAAQVAAVERLRASGEHRVGLLFVVGEERGSDGAAVANRQPIGSRFLINGEPTDNRLASATRGVLRVRLRARGRAAHSAVPEQGESAIDRLLDVLMRLRTLRWPVASALGQTFYNVGLIEGGVAPNVIPPHASAELLFRTIGPPEEILAVLRSVEPAVTIEEILRVPLVNLREVAVDGVETAVFPFTTDVPFLNNWGQPLLFGPGSILVAHTDHEHLALAELETAVPQYVQLARACLSLGSDPN